jgi:hypothetical protein
MKRLLLLALLAVNSLAPAATVIQTFNDIADVAPNNNLALIDLDAPGGVGFMSGYQQSNTRVPVIVTNDLVVGPANYGSGQAGTAQHGAVTPANFVPRDGTPGLVLGCMDADPTTFYPRVRIWYNPDVPNEASLPAPTLTFVDSSYAVVPTEITRIGYQVVRSATLGGFISPDYTDTNFSFGLSSVTIAAGQSSATVVAVVVDDALPAGNESVVFTPASRSSTAAGPDLGGTWAK